MKPALLGAQPIGSGLQTHPAALLRIALNVDQRKSSTGIANRHRYTAISKFVSVTLEQLIETVSSSEPNTRKLCKPRFWAANSRNE